jgi:hypothetical protein
MMVRLLYDYFRVLISVIAFVNKAVSGPKILHIAGTRFKRETRSPGCADAVVRAALSGGTDADLQRGLTPRPGALNIWHGESGETLISGDPEEEAKDRKPACCGLSRTHEKTPQAGPAGLILPKEGGGDNGSVS